MSDELKPIEVHSTKDFDRVYPQVCGRRDLRAIDVMRDDQYHSEFKIRLPRIEHEIDVAQAKAFGRALVKAIELAERRKQ